MLPVLHATRYVDPLREGGSLPGIVECDDSGTYVVKFRGAGQGLKVLVTEVVVAGLARALGIPTPDVAVVDLPSELARYEADEEVQDLLKASVGTNLAVDFLPGALPFDGRTPLGTGLASRLLWLDALTANPDRTWSNPNMLVWHGSPWAIDAGAALYFHFSWPSRAPSPERFAAQPFDARGHVAAREVDVASFAEVAEQGRELLSPTVVDTVLADVPDEWLEPTDHLPDPGAVRAAYRDHLLARLGSRAWEPDVSDIGDVTPRAHSGRPEWLR